MNPTPCALCKFFVRHRNGLWFRCSKLDGFKLPFWAFKHYSDRVNPEQGKGCEAWERRFPLTPSAEPR